MFVEQADGFQHSVVVVQAPPALGHVIQALGVGFGVFQIERLEVAVGGRRVPGQIIGLSHAHAGLIALKAGQLPGERFKFRARLRVFPRGDPAIAALQHLGRSSRWESRAQGFAQRRQCAVGGRGGVGRRIVVVDALVVKRGIGQVLAGLIGGREREIGIGLRQFRITLAQPPDGLGRRAGFDQRFGFEQNGARGERRRHRQRFHARQRLQSLRELLGLRVGGGRIVCRVVRQFWQARLRRVHVKDGGRIIFLIECDRAQRQVRRGSALVFGMSGGETLKRRTAGARGPIAEGFYQRGDVLRPAGGDLPEERQQGQQR